jgi:hypothetical protein
VVAGLLAACSGGSDDGSTTSPPPPPPPGDNVTISGRITYDFVPHSVFGGLDYGAIEARPARLVSVEFVEGTNVLVSTQTDTDGHYSLSVPPNTTGFVRARAESSRSGTPGWNFRVRDNTSANAIYTLDGDARSSGTTDSTRDLNAPSGWTNSHYGEPRAAAPFAILDTIYAGAEYLLAQTPMELPTLDIYWSPDNVSAFNDAGDPDPSTGQIGSSQYAVDPGFDMNGIYLVGEEDSDTDEYDPFVILHEFGHYLENQLGRSDSIGGPHARGDKLDLRVAFSEGWSTAFAGLALGDSVYEDTGGLHQGGSYSFDMEGRTNPAPGWYSEQSMYELIYDLGDAVVDGNDGIELPFADIWSVLTGHMVATRALTSIFPFLNEIKADHAGDASLVDALAGDQSIDPVTTDFGDGETNDAGDPAILPVYRDLDVNGPAVNVCSTDEFTSSATGSVNKLGSRRLIRFTPPAAGTVTIQVTATDIPSGHYADPDWVVHSGILSVTSEGPPSAACQDINNAAWDPSECVEPGPDASPATIPVDVDDYVLDVYEWTNTEDATLNPDYAPIGLTCFDVTVTQQ